MIELNDETDKEWKEFNIDGLIKQYRELNAQAAELHTALSKMERALFDPYHDAGENATALAKGIAKLTQEIAALRNEKHFVEQFIPDPVDTTEATIHIKTLRTISEKILEILGNETVSERKLIKKVAKALNMPETKIKTMTNLLIRDGVIFRPTNKLLKKTSF